MTDITSTIDLNMEALESLETPEWTWGEIAAAAGGLVVGVAIGVAIAT
jgi:hypothetical protein